MARQLFLDLDGVLADLDTHYLNLFGVYPDKSKPELPDFWPNIRAHGSFFRTMPMMPDALELWKGCKHWNPIILTGVPKSIPDVEKHKREWVAEFIDPHARVTCCFSAHKRNHAKPGDVLVDDWKKYRHLWLEMGGIFILHTSAADSLRQLHEVMDNV